MNIDFHLSKQFSQGKKDAMKFITVCVELSQCRIVPSVLVRSCPQCRVVPHSELPRCHYLQKSNQFLHIGLPVPSNVLCSCLPSSNGCQQKKKKQKPTNKHTLGITCPSPWDYITHSWVGRNGRNVPRVVGNCLLNRRSRIRILHLFWNTGGERLLFIKTSKLLGKTIT